MQAPTTGTSSEPSSATPEPSSATAEPSIPPIALAGLAGRLAFSFDTGIWVSSADGSGARQLTTDGGFDPSWSPDGRSIAYRLLTEHDDGEIWVVHSDGTGAHDLVNDPGFSDWGPAWSPDGRSIAFNSNRAGVLAIWLMDADGSNQRQVSAGHGEYPSWSPDGKRLVYAGGSYYDIRMVDVDGSHDHALTSRPAYDMAPAWSPDGTTIAYETQADYFPSVSEPGMGTEMEIHVISPDGSADRRLTSDRVEDYFPAWSSDGRALIWSRHGQLVVAHPDGSGLTADRPGNFPDWTSTSR